MSLVERVARGLEVRNFANLHIFPCDIHGKELFTYTSPTMLTSVIVWVDWVNCKNDLFMVSEPQRCLIHGGKKLGEI